MSAEGEQQRRPGAPDDTDGKRRLRAVSYPDPYLVTKLPLEGTVNSGVIRLGERMLLGFIHRPYPDGTRVRVVYDEWLFAERLEEQTGGDEGSGSKRATKKGAAKGDVKGAAKGAADGDVTGAKKGAKKGAANGAANRSAKGAGKSSSQGVAKSRAAEGSAKGAGKSSAAQSADNETTSRTEDRPAEDQARMFAGDPEQVDRTPFPDDFSDAERKARGDRIGGGDAWTDAFGDDDRNG